MPDAFTNATKVTKSYTLAASIAAGVVVPIEQSSVKVANELSITLHKHGGSLGSKDSASQKRRMKDQDIVENNARAITVPTLS